MNHGDNGDDVCLRCVPVNDFPLRRVLIPLVCGATILYMSNDTLPRGIHNAYLFQAFNAVSWQICLGSPLILFARELGAPAVVLGLLAELVVYNRQRDGRTKP